VCDSLGTLSVSLFLCFSVSEYPSLFQCLSDCSSHSVTVWQSLFLCLTIPLCVSVTVSPSCCLSVYLSDCVSNSATLTPTLSLSLCLTVRVSICYSLIAFRSLLTPLILLGLSHHLFMLHFHHFARLFSPSPSFIHILPIHLPLSPIMYPSCIYNVDWSSRKCSITVYSRWCTAIL
jgi:hypothetical protein